MSDPAKVRRHAERVRELVASVVRSQIKDPRLGMITITDARITADLRDATVFYTVLGDAVAQADTAAALESAKGLLRSTVGKALGLRHSPTLTFVLDDVQEQVKHIDDLLAEARNADAEVQRLAARQSTRATRSRTGWTTRRRGRRDGRGRRGHRRRGQRAGWGNAVTSTASVPLAGGWPRRDWTGRRPRRWCGLSRRVVGCCWSATSTRTATRWAACSASVWACGSSAYARCRRPSPGRRRCPSRSGAARAGPAGPGERRGSGPDLVICFDAASESRLGELAGRLSSATAALVLDHHASNPGFGTVNLVDPGAAATSVVAEQLLARLGVVVDPAIAECLYVALTTDTGSFRFEATTPAVHQMAARLLATGISPGDISRRVFDTRPFGAVRLFGEVLGRARLEPAAAGGRGLVWTFATLDDLARHDQRPYVLEALIDSVRCTAEADVSCVFKQITPGEWAVSMRSKGAVDVSRVAVTLGGGGHRFAAGFTGRGSAEQVVESIRGQLDAALIRPRG